MNYDAKQSQFSFNFLVEKYQSLFKFLKLHILCWRYIFVFCYKRKLMCNIGLPLWLSWWLVATCDVGDPGLITGLGRSPGEGKGYLLQYSGLENPMDSPWGHKESDTTELLSLSLSFSNVEN